MSRMKDMLGDTPYPHSPGYTDHTTSKAAAASVASTRGEAHEKILQVLGRAPATSDELAEALGWSILYTRPRVAELHKLGKIRQHTDEFGASISRKNCSGQWAKVWALRVT